MLLEFRHVDTHYGDLHVLKDVNYAIETGEIVALLGGNASGTSRNAITRADPVNRNRPGRGSASTVSLIASSNWGTRCTSSITIGPPLTTNSVGSYSADCRVPTRSRLRHTAPWASPI